MRVCTGSGGWGITPEPLEELSAASPNLAPGTIARDPMLAVPLVDNPRYRALKARLEAQMATRRLELPRE